MASVNKIIIADDHPLFRDALQGAVLQGFGDITIIDADSFSSLQHAAQKHDDCDLILLDLMMPGAVGFSALNYLGLTYPHIPVVIISGNDDSSVMARALDYGARAFVPKSTELTTIVDAIECVIDGNQWLPDDIQLPTQGNPDHREFAARLNLLTPKQFRVLMMLADGHQNKQIAGDLFISEATVKAHLTTVFQKLGVQNRTQAASLVSQYLKIERQDFLQQP
ncbi:MAG: response regulator transcription factor [Pseudomonadota bacterium]